MLFDLFSCRHFITRLNNTNLAWRLEFAGRKHVLMVLPCLIMKCCQGDNAVRRKSRIQRYCDNLCLNGQFIYHKQTSYLSKLCIESQDSQHKKRRKWTEAKSYSDRVCKCGRVWIKDFLDQSTSHIFSYYTLGTNLLRIFIICLLCQMALGAAHGIKILKIYQWP